MFSRKDMNPDFCVHKPSFNLINTVNMTSVSKRASFLQGLQVLRKRWKASGAFGWGGFFLRERYGTSYFPVQKFNQNKKFIEVTKFIKRLFSSGLNNAVLFHLHLWKSGLMIQVLELKTDNNRGPINYKQSNF